MPKSALPRNEHNRSGGLKYSFSLRSSGGPPRERANLVQASGNLGQAIESYHELLRQIRAAEADAKFDVDDVVHLSTICAVAGVLYRRAGRKDLASGLETRLQELGRHWDQKLPSNPFVQLQLAAKIVAAQPEHKTRLTTRILQEANACAVDFGGSDRLRAAISGLYLDDIGEARFPFKWAEACWSIERNGEGSRLTYRL